MTHNENTKTNDKATVWLMLLFGAGPGFAADW